MRPSSSRGRAEGAGRLGVAWLLVLAACTNERPETLVICHNANCAEPTDPEADDTLAALDESLALRFRGGPVLDGVEIDSFWDGGVDVCLFAHDLDNAERAPATAAAEALAERFDESGELTFSGGPFQVFIELKGTVDASETKKHSPAQRELHAKCAWQMYGILADGAQAADRAVEVVFTSFEPPLLRAMNQVRPPSTPLRVRFGAIQGIPAPLDGQTHSLDEYDDVGIDLVEMHPSWMLDGQFQAARSSDLDLVFWMFDATVEVLAAIDRFEPAMVETSEARLMRGWLEY
jgi:hypothetical protein